MRFKIIGKNLKIFLFDDRHCIYHFENGDNLRNQFFYLILNDFF